MNPSLVPDMPSARPVAPVRPVRVPRGAVPASASLGANKAFRASVWLALFEGDALSPSEATLLDELCEVRTLRAAAPLFHVGDPAPALLALAEGDVVLGRIDAQGGFRTENHVQGPAWLDLSSAWLGDARALHARTTNGATVFALPIDAVLQAIDRQSGLARKMILALAREARQLALNSHDLMHKDAPARLAAWLEQHCSTSVVEQQGAGPKVSVTVTLTMRKRDIASVLAITPETLSRLMRSFSGQGVIRVAGYTVHVLDRQALRRLAAA